MSKIKLFLKELWEESRPSRSPVFKALAKFLTLNNLNEIKYKELWETINAEIKAGHNETGLIILYSFLHKNLEDVPFCNYFLENVMNESLDSNQMVHILNALSPNKASFYRWRYFVTFCDTELRKTKTEEEVKRLLKVIL